MDSLSKEARRNNMANIRSHNTKPEMYIRTHLHKLGFRFYVNYKLPFGKPDIFFPKKKVAIFVHGCFWHRHIGCKFCYTLKSNSEFWNLKFERNIARDEIVRNKLRNSDIRLCIIWECTIKNMMKNNDVRDSVLISLSEFIESNEGFLEL